MTIFWTITAAMILAAHKGPGAVPESWIEGLSARDRIFSLLERTIPDTSGSAL